MRTHTEKEGREGDTFWNFYLSDNNADNKTIIRSNKRKERWFVPRCTSATWRALPATEHCRIQTQRSSQHPHAATHKHFWATFSSDIRLWSGCRFSIHNNKKSHSLHLRTAFVSILFYDAKWFFMWTAQSGGAGGEVAQSIKTYSRCRLYLLFSWNERKTPALLAFS